MVVPAYNHEQYIVQALDSIFAQTYQTIELIVIDDQSTDATFALVSQWTSQPTVKNRFAEITCLCNPVNLGAHDTINRGLAMASGELLTVLNSDDIYAAARIETLVNVMVQSGSEFSFSKVFCMDEEGGLIAEVQLPADLVESLSAADQVALTYPSLSFGFLENNLAISTGNMLISQRLFQKVGSFRPLKYVHDWDFALRAILETEPVYVPAPLYGYRLHANNSFRTLGALKDIELDAMAEHFSSLAAAGACCNPLAPTSQNWPYIFDAYVGSFYWLRWNRFARERNAHLDMQLKFDLEGADSMLRSTLVSEDTFR